ncbi:hypothetical protein SO694_00004126 [Aureococcus anophagefferens]|uniref:Uncharacterized protein n=1 Tax=Aureococcus anophagefferens TaxID=44056 RepID=A0ABR1G8R1_AURAN
MPLIINRSADGTPIFSFVGLGTDGSLGADGSQCDAPLPAGGGGRRRGPLKKSVAPANLSPPKPGRVRARAARAAREQREAGLAAGDEFLEAQMKRMGISGGALRVERAPLERARWRREAQRLRRSAAQGHAPAPPELHLANHERLLKKYERSLVASNGLEGDRTPLAEDLAPAARA